MVVVRGSMCICVICLVLDGHLRYCSSREHHMLVFYDSLDENNVLDFI